MRKLCQQQQQQAEAAGEEDDEGDEKVEVKVSAGAWLGRDAGLSGGGTSLDGCMGKGKLSSCMRSSNHACAFVISPVGSQRMSLFSARLAQMISPGSPGPPRSP